MPADWRLGMTLRWAVPASKSSAAALPPLARPWPSEGVDTHFSGVGMATRSARHSSWAVPAEARQKDSP